MKKLKLYIETSTWNFVFADDSPEKMATTKEFLDLVRKGVYMVYISEVVEAEINRAPEAIKHKLLKLIDEIDPVVLKLAAEAEDLADIYIRKAELFFGVNLEQGFHKKVEIITPWEVIGYVED